MRRGRRLRVLRAFWRGVASIDIEGGLRLTSRRRRRGDAERIAGDLRRVGDDIRRALADRDL